MENSSRYNLKKAYIKANGKKILDNSDHLLAVNAFSHPIHTKLSFDELKKKILYDKDRPNDYIFSFRFQYRFWENNWGFSLPYKKVRELDEDAEYEVLIDSEFKVGAGNEMLQAEFFKRGEKKEEILFVGHFDHPGQVNDGLAGTVAAFEVIQSLQSLDTKYSYRSLASVEIVGSAAFLEQRSDVQNIKEGIL